MADTQEFFDREHVRLMQVETSITKTRSELETARTEALESLKNKRTEASMAVEDRHQKMSDGVGRMRARLEAKRQETAANVDHWKQQRAVHQLESRAQDAEDYADVATSVLELAQQEARAASLAAIEARRDAEEAKAKAKLTAAG